MQTQPTINQPVSIVDQIGNLLPQLTKMACFMSFCAFRVENMDEESKKSFGKLSDDLSTIFFSLSELYVTMSEVERKNIGNQDKGGVYNGKD